MQIREISLKELESTYEIVQQLYCELSFKEFDDLVYDMRHIEYKMIGLFEREKLITFAGVSIRTSFQYKRHLYIYDLVTDYKYRKRGYAKDMLEYLYDYGKSAMCVNIILSVESSSESTQKFYKNLGFSKKSAFFKRSL